MANVHKLIVVGRLVSDPKVRTLTTGGRVAKFGLPIDFSRRTKNPTTGQWEGDSFIIDVDAWNRDTGMKLADNVEQFLKKGSLVYVEGRLKPNDYTDKNGQKVFKPVLVADVIRFLDPRPDGGEPMGEEGARPSRTTSAPPARRPVAPAPVDDGFDEPAHGGAAPEHRADDDIPF